jgi:flagellin FlaB
MGKNMYNILRRRNVGAMGVGAMIIFIAMVVVAGIAAAVIIQTSSKLETQALKTGDETLAVVASGVKILGIDGHNTDGAIDQMAIYLSVLSGSPDFDIGQAVVELSNSENKYLLRYGGALTNTSDVNGSIFDVTEFGNDTTFAVIVFQDADGSLSAANPVLNYGDHVALAIDVGAVFGGSIPPRTDVFGLVIPEEGAYATIGFTTPASITTEVVELQ